MMIPSSFLCFLFFYLSLILSIYLSLSFSLLFSLSFFHNQIMLILPHFSPSHSRFLPTFFLPCSFCLLPYLAPFLLFSPFSLFLSLFLSVSFGCRCILLALFPLSSFLVLFPPLTNNIDIQITPENSTNGIVCIHNKTFFISLPLPRKSEKEHIHSSVHFIFLPTVLRLSKSEPYWWSDGWYDYTTYHTTNEFMS